MLRSEGGHTGAEAELQRGDVRRALIDLGDQTIDEDQTGELLLPIMLKADIKFANALGSDGLVRPIVAPNLGSPRANPLTIQYAEHHAARSYASNLLPLVFKGGLAASTQTRFER